MDDSSRRMFDPSPQPFRILRVDPTKHQIDPALSPTQQNRTSSADALSFEQEVLRDPTRRLSYELSCPIDCPASELEALYAALSDSAAPTDELLSFADRLWPLTRANFVAHIVSHRPATAALLYALLESHASIDANVIYAKLKAVRTAAGIPAPSWISFHQGLDDLLNIHTAAAFVGYHAIEDAVEPMLECTQQILADGERHLVEALGSLLGPYRRLIDTLQKDAAEQIATICAALQEQPDDASLIEPLANAIQIWMSTSGPLRMWSGHQGRHELDFDTPVDNLRSLIAGLAENRHYEVAVEIVEVTRDLFSAVPTTLDRLADDARLIEDLLLHTTIGQLQDIIDELAGDPGPLVAALERDGFAETSSEPAKALWEAFVRGAKAANEQSREAAWRSIQDFAIRLSNRPEAAAAVVRLLTGLIQYGEEGSAPPQFLKALRGNLDFMRSFIGSDAVETKVVVGQTPRTGSKRNRRIGLAALAFLALLVPAMCGYAVYLNLDHVRSIWPKLSWSQPAMSNSSGETMPPVGTGQHLDLDGVRYCHFQQERLRIIKQQVQGPQDARAYNLLIVDYNSRCSDFFYQDNDLKVVLDEVNAKKKLLEADAKQIMSTWPGHAGN